MFLVQLLNPLARIPRQATTGSAGYDLSSVIDCIVPARGKIAIPIGVAIKIGKGTYGRVASRSSLSYKFSIEVGAGVIDSDYNEEIHVILYNHSDVDYTIKVGDRIAQLILERITSPVFQQVETIKMTDEQYQKGEYLVIDSAISSQPTETRVGGFGSTGI